MYWTVFIIYVTIGMLLAITGRSKWTTWMTPVVITILWLPMIAFCSFSNKWQPRSGGGA